MVYNFECKIKPNRKKQKQKASSFGRLCALRQEMAAALLMIVIILQLVGI